MNTIFFVSHLSALEKSPLKFFALSHLLVKKNSLYKIPGEMMNIFVVKLLIKINLLSFEIAKYYKKKKKTFAPSRLNYMYLLYLSKKKKKRKIYKLLFYDGTNADLYLQSKSHHKEAEFT